MSSRPWRDVILLPESNLNPIAEQRRLTRRGIMRLRSWQDSADRFGAARWFENL
jgi:hypothetical protein